jgi:ubiquinone/menaquinone biosynthesis C-methylase UbiE
MKESYEMEIDRVNYEYLNASQIVSETDPFTVERYKQFLKYFPHDARDILDIGCNTGRGGKILKSKHTLLNLVGLDCVKSRLEQLPKGLYDSYIYGFSTHIDLPDSSFDIICAGEFIEHLKLSDAVQTLRECYRVLRPKGILLLTTPNPSYLRLYFTGKKVLGGAHLSQFYSTGLSEILTDVGFSNLIVKGSGKITRLLGENFPFLCFYGSYLVSATKTF